MVSSKENKKKFKNGVVSSIRIYFLIFLVLSLGFLIFFRLYSLQVINHDKYQSIANAQHKGVQRIDPFRGEIFLKEKDGLFPVAVNKELMEIFVVPSEVENKIETSRILSEKLELDFEKIITKIDNLDSKYELIKRRVEPDLAQEIESIRLKGVYFRGEYWRYYPGGNLASQTIGFVGYLGKELGGRYGVENQFENQLKGRSGTIYRDRDTFGRWISVGKKEVNPARNGSKIVLSIDYIIQFKIETILRNAIKKHGADGGKVVVINPWDGSILAMTTMPDYNLNNYSSVEDIAVFMNPIISHEYECGSVFKPITMSIGLDMGKIQPETTYFDSGSIKEAGYEIKNSDKKSHGEQNMTQVIEKSLNTGVIFVKRQVGNNNFLRYLKDFGFGSLTNIDFPGEIRGNLSNLKSNRNIEFYTASFGQGITVTPIQLAMAYSVMANGGELLKPKLIDYIEDPLGERDYFEKEFIRTVISRDTANKITLMMEENVSKGHGKLAGVPGFRIAGKTGTAQVADLEKGGYLEGATTGTFAGYGPIENPAFVMIVIIDNPRDVQWAESTASPVFGEIAKFLLEYFNKEPTEEYTREDLEFFNQKHNYSNYEEDQKKKELKKD